MKKILVPVFAALSALCAAADRRTSFDFDWRFRPGPCQGAERADFDDSSWRTLDLPHDFQFETPWDEKAPQLRGYKHNCEGWYRKSFRADPAWKGQRVRLDFEGMLCWGDVYLNGTKIGGSDFGFLGCAVDLTDHLRYDGDNHLAVWVTTGGTNSSRWYTGGGLFRDVWLEVVPVRGILRHGVAVTTPEVKDGRATVLVRAELEGFHGVTNAVTLSATVRDPSGRPVGMTQGRLADTNITRPEIALAPLSVADPQLWDLDHPRLYTACVSVFVDDRLVDEQTVRFGIRTLEFGPDFGFRLNGRKVFVQGVANHHDLGGLGAAAFRRGVRRTVQTLKDWGFNAIRTSHNPYSISLMEACDELGMLVVDEWSDKWNNFTGDNMASRLPFGQIAFTSIPDWIRRDRNHPSVILWSLGNELQCWDWTNGFAFDDWGVTTYRILDVLVKRYDASRKTTVAQYPAARNATVWNDPANWNDPEPSPMLLATEVASQNYFQDRYHVFRRKYPNLILFQSEAGTSGLLGPAVEMDRDTTVGFAYWGAVEYWGETDRWPKKGWNYSWFAHDLEPYPQAWLARSYLRPDEPIAKIGVEVGEEVKELWNDMTVGQRQIRSTWNFRPGTKSIDRVFVYSNAEEAELFVNGRSLGAKKLGRKADSGYNTAEWRNVPYGEGGVLKAIARTDGRQTATDEIATTGAAAKLEIVAENADDWSADGNDLLYVRLRALDSAGRRVPDAIDSVQIEISGAASLQALDDCDHSTGTLPLDNPKRLHHGRMLAILRAARIPGEVRFKASSPTLGEATAVFRTK